MYSKKRFEQLETLISNYNPEHLIYFAIKKNYQLFYNRKNNLIRKYLPWNLLLLIKMAYAFGGKLQKNDLREDRFEYMSLLLNNIYTGGGETLIVDGGVNKFMRQMAFQQFWLQTKYFDVMAVGRQIEVFSIDKNKQMYEAWFLQATNLTIDDFMSIAVVLAHIMATQEGKDFYYVNVNTIQIILKGMPTIKIETFYNLLSLDFNEAAKFCLDKYSKRPFGLQLFENSPLKRFPFLNEKNIFYAYSPVLYFQAINTIIYDLLKEKFGDKFTDKFGDSMEAYAHKLLNHFNYEFLSENDLKKIKSGNVVDFLLKDSEATVLVEIKASQLQVQAQLKPLTDIMLNSLRTNVIKAVYQSIEVANFVKTTTHDKLTSTSKTNFFSIVVTYKDFYLGNGKSVWKEFMERAMQTLYPNTTDFPILAENIFYISLEEFEQLVAISGGSTKRIIEILSKARDDNYQVSSAKFNFQQHLDEYIKDERQVELPFLVSHIQNILDKALKV